MIDEVDKTCRDMTVYMIAAEGKRLAELVRQKAPVAVECGTAIGYSPVDHPRAEGRCAVMITIEIDAARSKQARGTSSPGSRRGRRT